MESEPANAPEAGTPEDDGKVVNLAVYKIKRSLQSEGFDLITDDKGKLTLVLRMPGAK